MQLQLGFGFGQLLVIIGTVGILILPTHLSAQSDRKVTPIAEGVYEIEHSETPYESGNTTVIIGERPMLPLTFPSLSRTLPPHATVAASARFFG